MSGQGQGIKELAGRQVILASASPRRNELLRQVGIVPLVEPSHVEEVMTSTVPERVVMELSRQKAEDVAAMHDGADAVVIGADTVVAVDGRILGKPGNQEEAKAMIGCLQGRKHQVYTGVTMIYCGDYDRDSETDSVRNITFAECTDVEIYPMTAGQTEAYVATGDPLDKAGAYGIQGQFAAYVKGIRGDYNNVVGLPVGRVCQELLRWFSGG